MSASAISAPRAEKSIRQLTVVGLTISFILVVVIGGLLALVPLSGAVIAQGQVVVSGSVKLVQHSTGGIVTAIHVEDGDRVAPGDVLIELDDTMARSARDIFRGQLDEALARRARLLAEVSGEAAIDFSDLEDRAGIAGVDAAMAREQQVFDTRQQARLSQESQLRERIGQIEREVEGLQAQSAAAVRSAELVSTELEGVRDLYEQGLVPLSRLTDLEQQDASIQGQHGQLVAEIARAEGRIIETRLQITQLGTQFRDNALGTLSQTQVQIAELTERLRAAQDQLDRVTISAQQAGIVHELAVHTIGGVVGSGETLMQIIPTADELVIEVAVAPTEIDQIAIGQPVRVQIQAGNQRLQNELDGQITRVSADLSTDERTGAGFYLARVRLSESAITGLGDFDLIPGMQATAFIQTGTRTALEYLLKPLSEQVARAFRER